MKIFNTPKFISHLIRSTLYLAIAVLLAVGTPLTAKAGNQIEFKNQQSNVKISGVIRDDKKQPIVDAVIEVKGTNKATLSDLNGNFTIEMSVGQILTVSFLGFKTAELTITKSEKLNIILQSDDIEIDDVVVVGFSAQKKSKSYRSGSIR